MSMLDILLKNFKKENIFDCAYSCKPISGFSVNEDDPFLYNKNEFPRSLYIMISKFEKEYKLNESEFITILLPMTEDAYIIESIINRELSKKYNILFLRCRGLDNDSIIILRGVAPTVGFDITEITPDFIHDEHLILLKLCHFEYMTNLKYDPLFNTYKNGKRKTITLCGSTKFKKEFEKWYRKLSCEGNVVLTVVQFSHADDLNISKDDKEKFDKLHKDKILLSDEIFVIDVDKYIGDSTKDEIEFAAIHKVKVRYMSEEVKINE